MAHKIIQNLRTVITALTIFLIACSLTTIKSYAQNTDFSQVFNNYVYLNPAFVGTTTCPHAFTSYRAKNVSLDGYHSAYVSFDMGMEKQNANIGFSLLQDNQGNVFSETEVLAIYAHTFQLRKKLFMNASLAAGYVHSSTIPSNLIFPNMLDVFQDDIGATRESFEKYSHNNLNSECGILFYNDLFYAGMTVKNLQGNISIENKNENLFPRTFSFHAMAKLSTTKAFMLKYLIWIYPQVNLVVGKTSSYTQMGVILQKWFLQFGGAYRQNLKWNANSLSFFVGVVEKKFRFAYSCDMTINSTKRFDTHEVTLSYQFDCREKKKKFEAVKAPTF